MSRRYAALVLILGLALVAAAIAIAAGNEGVRSADGTITNAKSTHGHHQHGDLTGHLPASQANVRLVSKLELKNVVRDKIADVGVWKGHAYLAAWGGAAVQVQRRPRRRHPGHRRAQGGCVHPGEGRQRARRGNPDDCASTRRRSTGDVLVSNNEKCKDKTGVGGLNIYDVSRAVEPDRARRGIRRRDRQGGRARRTRTRSTASSRGTPDRRRMPSSSTTRRGRTSTSSTSRTPRSRR